MNTELGYTSEYNTTINNLAFRENVMKILQEVNAKTNLAKEMYPQSKLKPSETVHIDNSLTSDLPDTVNFLESHQAVKLLSLTEKHSTNNNETLLSFELNIDITKANIFAA